jgi:hypothetical protein
MNAAQIASLVVVPSLAMLASPIRTAILALLVRALYKDTITLATAKNMPEVLERFALLCQRLNFPSELPPARPKDGSLPHGDHKCTGPSCAGSTAGRPP